MDALLSSPPELRTLLVAKTDLSNRTALHYVKEGMSAGSLLGAGADPCHKDSFGSTPLHSVKKPEVAQR